jgi:acyl-CoA oxidase
LLLWFAVLSAASDDQRREWFPTITNLEAGGCYGQTVLGHGATLRARESTATLDKSTDEWVIDSPYLTSGKAWPGSFATIASHCVLYCRMVIDGKDYGINSFFVQLRDAQHKCMPGVELYEMGPKMGYNLVDNGYCMFHNVRVPRTNLLSRFKQVSKAGVVSRPGGKKKKQQSSNSEQKKKNKKVTGKLGHLVMIATRAAMTKSAFVVLAKSTTIATRYSAVRLQGFKNTKGANAVASGEFAVLDYQNQQQRIFKALSFAVATHFSAAKVNKFVMTFRNNMDAGDFSALPELHATAAGLKAVCTHQASIMSEVCRRACGGHGVLMCNGIAKHVQDYSTIGCVAEGDMIILLLQTARFLVRSVQAAAAGNGDSIPGAGRYLASKIGTPRFNDKAALLSIDNLLCAFAWRSQRASRRVTKRLAAAQATGQSFDLAWNSCALALRKASEDHVFYVLLRNFVDATLKVKDTAVRAVLETLVRHFALQQVFEHGADWMDCMKSADFELVHATLLGLLAEIRPNAVAIVDSFNLSDNQLQSAIGRYDGNVYEAMVDYFKKSSFNDDAWVADLHRDVLSEVLDPEFANKTATTQRVLSSKL